MRALGVLMIVCLVVFARATAGAAEAGQGYGAWHWEAELDRMEDTQTVRVYTHALAPVTLRWDPVRPVLLVACFRDTTYVLVDVKTFLTHDRVAVAWRLDREPPIRGTYPLTRDGETFILAHGAAAIDMADVDALKSGFARGCWSRWRPSTGRRGSSSSTSAICAPTWGAWPWPATGPAVWMGKGARPPSGRSWSAPGAGRRCGPT